MADGDPNPNPHNISDAMWWLWAGGLSVLEPTSQLGGIYAFKSGFHNTRANNEKYWPLNYSIRDAINQQGPGDKAAAIDWTFAEAQRGDYRRINTYSARLDRASRAQDPRLAGWYEWYGTDSGRNIGWNIFQNRFASSDDSHDWHIHLSEIRAFVGSRANKEALLSVLRGESLEAYLARGGQLVNQDGDNDMTPGESAQLAELHSLVRWNMWGWLRDFIHATNAQLAAIAAKVDISPEELEQIRASAEAGARKGVAETVTPETIAAAIPDGIAAEVVDLLRARLAE